MTTQSGPRCQARRYRYVRAEIQRLSLRTGDLATNPTTLSTLSVETKVPDHEVFRRRFPIPQKAPKIVTPTGGGLIIYLGIALGRWRWSIPFTDLSDPRRAEFMPNSRRLRRVELRCAGSIGVSDKRFRA